MQPVVPQQQQPFQTTASSAQSYPNAQHPSTLVSQLPSHSHSLNSPYDHLVQQSHSAQQFIPSHMGMQHQQQHQQQQQSLDPVGSRMLHSHLSVPGKQRPPQHYGQRYNPMLASASHPSANMSHNDEHAFSHIRLPDSTSPMGLPSSQDTHYNSSAASFSSDKVQHMYPQSLTPSPGLHPTLPNTGGVARPQESMIHSGSAPGRSNDLLMSSWASTTVPSYVHNFEV